jgi:membrane protein required for colicin V production
MNLLDIVITVGMALLIIRGILRGFFREVGALAGVILGIWLSNAYQPQMTAYLKPYLPSLTWLPLISFAVIFLIVFIICSLAGWGMKVILKKVFFGWADRTLGAGLAIFKGVIITYFAIVLLTFFVPSQAPLIAGSKLAPFIISSYQSMISIVSPGSYQRWKQKFLGTKKGGQDVAPGTTQGSAGKNGPQ